MLDDLHEVQSPACHDVLGVVMAGMPTVRSSSWPVVPSNRTCRGLRASGDAVEFGAGDLALDAAGAQQIFSEVGAAGSRARRSGDRTHRRMAGRPLPRRVDREGEPDGEAMRSRVTTATWPTTSTANRWRSSPRSCSGSCAARRCSISSAVRCAMRSSGSRVQTRSCATSRRRTRSWSRSTVGAAWYRYHALFREFLLGELRRREPDIIAKLHLRAADWYEANGSPAMALEHLLNTTERDRCVAAADRAGAADLQRGPDVDRAAVALGARRHERRRRTRRSRCSPAGSQLLTGRHHRRAAVGRDRRRGVVRPGAARRLGFVRVGARDVARVLCAAGPERMVDDADFAVAAEPPWSPWRDTALRPAAPKAHLLAAISNRPRPCSRRRPPLARQWETSTRSCSAEAELALLAMDRGEWAEPPSTSGSRSPRSTSTGCTTTPCRCSRSPARPGSRCTGAT